MKLTRNEIAAIKRVAMTVQPLLKKKDKINNEIAKLESQKNEIDEDIKTWELGIKTRTGYGIEELVERETVNGKTIFKVKEDILEPEDEQSQEENTVDQEQTQDEPSQEEVVENDQNYVHVF